MKVFKRLIALVLSITLLTSTFTACSSLNLNANDAIISKAEWIDLLAGHFGLQNDDSVDPYFSDISQNNQNFKNVQACVEWGVLKPSSKFSPNSKVSREFVFATAVRAIGKKITNLADDASDMEAAKKAVELGFAKNKSWLYMHEGVSEEEADKIATDASIVYCGQKIVDHDNTKYQSGVKFQENTEGYIINTNNDTVTVSDDAKKDNGYKEGDIVVFGTGKETKQYRIVGVSKQEGKTVYKTEKPEISEVYDEIDVGGVGKIQDVSDIKCSEGVKLTSVDGVSLTDCVGNIAASALGLADGNPETKNTKNEKGANLKVDIEFGSASKPKVSVSSDIGNGTAKGYYDSEEKGNPNDYDIDVQTNGKTDSEAVNTEGQKIPNDLMSKYEEAKITKNKNGSTTTVTTGKQVKGGWKIAGSLEFSNLQPEVDVQTKKFLGVTTGFKSFDIQCNPTITGKIGFQGYKSFEWTLFQVDYTIGILTLELSVKMKANFNGELSYSVSVKSKNHISYNESNGFKKVSSSEVDQSIDLNLTFKYTPVAVTFAIKLGWFNLIDVTISISLEFSLKLSGTWFVYSKEGIFRKGGDE